MTNAAPAPLLSAATRYATAAVVCLFVGLAWITAGHQSHDAVETTAAILAHGPAAASSVTVVGAPSAAHGG